MEYSRLLPPLQTLRKVHLHGSQMVQSLLQFQNPKVVVSSLLHMTPDDIITVSCDPSGSHALEAFMASHTVPLKKKNKLTDKLEVSSTTLTSTIVIIYTHSLSLSLSGPPTAFV